MAYNSNKIDAFDADRIARIAEVQVAHAMNGIWGIPASLTPEQASSPYPLNALPSGIGDAVSEVLDFVQCPIALAACSALSALSLWHEYSASKQFSNGCVCGARSRAHQLALPNWC